jgi:hypothetical protein
MLNKLIQLITVLTSNELSALEGGAPGSLQIFADTASLGNVIQFVAAVVPGSALVGKTFDIGIHQEMSGFELNTDSIHFDSFACTDAGLSFKDGDTNRLQLHLSKINANGLITGNLTDAKGGIHATPDYWNITDASIVIDFTTDSEDNIVWTLDENTNITFGDLQIHFKEAFMNFFMKSTHQAFMETVSFAMYMVETSLNGAVQALNEMIAAEAQNPDTFIADVAGFALNFTMTRFPEITQEQTSLTVNIDARAESKTFGKTVVPANTEWATKQDSPQKEQIFVHQSMLESMIYDFKPVFKNETAAAFIAAVPEITAHYGEAVDCELVVAFPTIVEGAVTINTAEGVRIGPKEHGMPMTVTAMCAADATAEKEAAVVVATNATTVFNGTFTDFTLYAKFENTAMRASHLESSLFDVSSVKSYTDLIDNTIGAEIEAFNAKFGEVIDLKMKYPTLGFVAGIVKNLVLTPFQVDHFLFAGFKWISDM